MPAGWRQTGGVALVVRAAQAEQHAHSSRGRSLATRPFPPAWLGQTPSRRGDRGGGTVACPRHADQVIARVARHPTTETSWRDPILTFAVSEESEPMERENQDA